MKYLAGIIIGIQLCLTVHVARDWMAHPELTAMQFFQRHGDYFLSLALAAQACGLLITGDKR